MSKYDGEKSVGPWSRLYARLQTSLRDKANLLSLLSLSKRRLAQPVSNLKKDFVLIEKQERYKSGKEVFLDYQIILLSVAA